MPKHAFAIYYIKIKFTQMIVNNKPQQLLSLGNPLISSFSENKLAGSIIKFIDIILTLYSPVPFEIRNQMRVLQNTLLYSREKNLDEYIEQLEEKLNIKEKYKQAQQAFSDNNITKHLQSSAIKTHRNTLNDSDKENRINISNIKITSCENGKKYGNPLNVTLQINRTRKVSALQSCDKSFDCEDDSKKNLSRQLNEIGKNSSKTLLKIIKKNRTSKEQLSVTERSFDCSISHTKIYQTLKTNVNEILSIMDKTQSQFKLPLNESWKNSFELVDSF